VVLYELLTGRRPFRGDSAAEVLNQIATIDPRPLRQIDDTIPSELERICLKAMVLEDAYRNRRPRQDFLLAAFGRAYGALPDKVNDLFRDHESFLDKSVLSLAQDGKVVPVRLALFAEMVKSKLWVPVTLRQAGGADRIGQARRSEAAADS